MCRHQCFIFYTSSRVWPIPQGVAFDSINTPPFHSFSHRLKIPPAKLWLDFSTAHILKSKYRSRDGELGYTMRARLVYMLGSQGMSWTTRLEAGKICRSRPWSQSERSLVQRSEGTKRTEYNTERQRLDACAHRVMASRNVGKGNLCPECHHRLAMTPSYILVNSFVAYLIIASTLCGPPKIPVSHADRFPCSAQPT